jgi:hypothetical protein
MNALVFVDKNCEDLFRELHANLEKLKAFQSVLSVTDQQVHPLLSESTTLAFVSQDTWNHLRSQAKGKILAKIVLFQSKSKQLNAETLELCKAPVSGLIRGVEKGFSTLEVQSILKPFRKSEGLPKEYLPFSLEPEKILVEHKTRVCNHTDKKNALQEFSNRLGEVAKQAGLPSDHISLRQITEVVDELLINGIFHANPSLKGKLRGAGYVLLNHQSVVLTYHFGIRQDGSRKVPLVIVSVKDPFGTLTFEDVKNHISISQDAMIASAAKQYGLGLRITHERSQALHFRVKSGTYTSITCYFEVFENYRSQTEGSRTLIFEMDEEGRAA